MSILGERFFKLSNALFCYHLTPIQFTVYSFLVSSAGQKGVCWPSVKTIAASCGCSVNAAREAIRVLEQLGFIRCVKRYRDLPQRQCAADQQLIFHPRPAAALCLSGAGHPKRWRGNV